MFYFTICIHILMLCYFVNISSREKWDKGIIYELVGIFKSDILFLFVILPLFLLWAAFIVKQILFNHQVVIRYTNKSSILTELTNTGLAFTIIFCLVINSPSIFLLFVFIYKNGWISFEILYIGLSVFFQFLGFFTLYLLFLISMLKYRNQAIATIIIICLVAMLNIFPWIWNFPNLSPNYMMFMGYIVQDNILLDWLSYYFPRIPFEFFIVLYFTFISIIAWIVSKRLMNEIEWK